MGYSKTSIINRCTPSKIKFCETKVALYRERMNTSQLSANLETYVNISIENTVCVVSISTGTGNRLRNDNRNNQSIDTQNSGHNNRNDILNNSFRVVNTHVADTQSSSPGSPSRTPAGKDHTSTGTQITAAKIIEFKARRVHLLVDCIFVSFEPITCHSTPPEASKSILES